MEMGINPKFSATWSNSSNILHCIIEGKWLKNSVDVLVEENYIIVRKGHSKWKFVLPGIVLQPDTCRGLKITSTNELQFSMRGLRSAEKEDVYKMKMKSFSMQNETVDKIQKLQNKWYCALCKQKILSDWSILTRVLPLPSENWSDFTDMWFCHNHGNEDPPTKKQGRLLPKERECFVGETYVLVARKHVNSGFIRLTKSGTVLCKRCGRQLGEALDYKNGGSAEDLVIKFFLHTLLIEDLAFTDLIHSDISCAGRSNLNSFFSRLVQEQSETFASFRFIIESQSGMASEDTPSKSSTCLLWLLDYNVQMFKSDSRLKNDVTQSEISVDGATKNAIIKKDVTKDDLTKNGVIKDGVTQPEVKQTAVSKVLFKCQLNGLSNKRPDDYVTKSVISLWRKDNTVHGVQLPYPIFLQLVNLLIENCKTLPPSQRYLNGFHVSYLQNEEVT